MEHVQKGWLKTIIGPVSSDKSSTLVRHLGNHAVEGRKTMGFVSELALEPGRALPQGYVGDLPFEVMVVKDAFDILLKVFDGGIEVVGIDNGHYLQNGLIDCVDSLVDKGRWVILASRETDFRGEPFDIIARLVAKSDHAIERLFTKCRVCGGIACRSQRFRRGRDGQERPALRNDGTHTVCVDGVRYEPRCRNCHEVPVAYS